MKLVVEGETPLIEVAYRAPDILNDEYYSFLLINAFLTGARGLDAWGRTEQASAARSSRLYKALVDRRLATRVNSSLIPTRHPYLYKLNLTLPDSSQFQLAEESVFEEFERLKNYGATSYELSKARNQLIAEAFLDQDSISKLGYELGLFESIASYKLIQDFEEKISNVSNDDLRRVAGKYFLEDSRTIGWFVPLQRRPRVEVERLSRMQGFPYEEGLKGHEKVAQGRADELQELEVTAGHDALGRRSEYMEGLALRRRGNPAHADARNFGAHSFTQGVARRTALAVPWATYFCPLRGLTAIFIGRGEHEGLTDRSHQALSNWLRPAFGFPERSEALLETDKADVRSVDPKEQAPKKKTVAGAVGSGGPPIPRITLIPQKRTLPNGVTVVAAESGASPTVTIEASVKAGSARDRDQNSGLAYLVGKMLERGTKSRNISQVAEGFDFLGAHLRTETDYLSTTLIVRGLSKDSGSLIQQLSEILQSPAFLPAEFDKVRTECLTRLREDLEDTRLRAVMALRQKIYPAGHPYGRTPGGSITTIEKLKLSDLTAFYKRFYRPDQLTISVAGAIQPDRVFQMAENSFGKWTVSADLESISIPETQPGLGKGQHIVRMIDKPQCELALGYPAVSVRNPDYYPMLVISQILGQSGADGRLGIRLRDREGLAFYARVFLDAGLGEGPLIIQAGTGADRVDHVVEIIRDEIARIKSQGVTSQELAAAKQRLIESYPVEIESNEGIARQLLKIELLGLGEDYFNRFSILIGGVTMDQITDCLRTYFPIDQAALVIAGPYPPR